MNTPPGSMKEKQRQAQMMVGAWIPIVRHPSTCALLSKYFSSATGATSNPAWGNAPGSHRQYKRPALKARFSATVELRLQRSLVFQSDSWGVAPGSNEPALSALDGNRRA